MADLSKNISRREWVKKSLQALLGLGSIAFIAKFFSYNPKKEKSKILIDKSQLPKQGALVFALNKAAIINNESEVYGVSLKCPHLGCTLNLHSEGFTCPCHGSRFDKSGNYVFGPAPQNLKRFVINDLGTNWELLLD